MTAEQLKEKSEELWDEFSEYMGRGIDDADDFAGQSLLTQRKFSELIDKLLSSPSSKGGMKWTKASERNPSKEGEYFVHAKDGASRSMDVKLFQRGHWFTTNHSEEVIEWLDESYTEQELRQALKTGWVNSEKRLPTKEDADKDGCVFGWDKIQGVPHKVKFSQVIDMKIRFSYWCKLPPQP